MRYKEYRGVLLNCDGTPDAHGHIYQPSTLFKGIEKTLPVMQDMASAVPYGHVGITMDLVRLKYLMLISEPFVHLVDDLIPCIAGQLLAAHPHKSYSGALCIDELRISYITLSRTAADKRITALKLNAFDYGQLKSPSDASCECGSEKAGLGTHSTWCPKHG